jgi:hypothetical protein
MKKAIIVVGVLIAAGFYFSDDLARIADRVGDGKAAEYGAVSAPGMIRSADNVGQSLDGTFGSIGGAMR